MTNQSSGSDPSSSASGSAPGSAPSTARPAKASWFAPTSAHYLCLVVLLQLFLYLSVHFQWFAFNKHKGYTVLIAVAATAILLLLWAAWIVLSSLFRSKAQYSLATLFWTVPVLAIPFGWLAHDMDAARQQQAAMDRLRSRALIYDEQSSQFFVPPTDFLTVQLGRLFFVDVFYVDVHYPEARDIEDVRQFTRVQELKLTNRRFTDRPPEITDADLRRLQGLTQVENLQLGGTKITDQGLETLARFKRLKHLALVTPRVTGDGLRHLQNLDGLEGVVIHQANISDQGFAHVQGMTQLKRFVITHPCTTDAGLAHLTRLTNLETLYVAGPKISDTGVEHLQPLTKLKTLFLTNTSVTDASLSRIGQLTELVELNLDGAAITGTGLGELQSLKKLVFLDLSRTQVSDAHLPLLKELPSLKQLMLETTQVTEEGAWQLRESMPRCEIRRARSRE
jgi:hypothetical protein